MQISPRINLATNRTINVTSSTSGQAIQNIGSFALAKSFRALTVGTTRAEFTAAKLIVTTIVYITIIICWVVGHDFWKTRKKVLRCYYNVTTAELDLIKLTVTSSPYFFLADEIIGSRNNEMCELVN